MEKLLISVSQSAVMQAEQAIEACSHCFSSAKLPFWRVLNSFRSHSPDQVLYIFPVLGRCPKCKCAIDETTLVEPKWYLLKPRP